MRGGVYSKNRSFHLLWTERWFVDAQEFFPSCQQASWPFIAFHLERRERSPVYIYILTSQWVRTSKNKQMYWHNSAIVRKRELTLHLTARPVCALNRSDNDADKWDPQSHIERILPFNVVERRRQSNTCVCGWFLEVKIKLLVSSWGTVCVDTFTAGVWCARGILLICVLKDIWTVQCSWARNLPSHSFSVSRSLLFLFFGFNLNTGPLEHP